MAADNGESSTLPWPIMDAACSVSCSLAGNRPEEGLGAQGGCLNRQAHGHGRSFELALGHGVPGGDEGGVAGVRERIAEGHGAQGTFRIAFGIFEGPAVHREGGRARYLGVRGEPVAEHGQGIDHFEDGAGRVLAQHGGVVAVAAGAGRRGQDGAGGRPEGHNGRGRSHVCQRGLGQRLQPLVQGGFQRSPRDGRHFEQGPPRVRRGGLDLFPGQVGALGADDQRRRFPGVACRIAAAGLRGLSHPRRSADPSEASICSAVASPTAPSTGRAKVRLGASGTDPGMARAPGTAAICSLVTVRPSSRRVMARTKASGPAALTWSA